MREYLDRRDSVAGGSSSLTHRFLSSHRVYLAGKSTITAGKLTTLITSYGGSIVQSMSEATVCVAGTSANITDAAQYSVPVVSEIWLGWCIAEGAAIDPKLFVAKSAEEVPTFLLRNLPTSVIASIRKCMDSSLVPTSSLFPDDLNWTAAELYWTSRSQTDGTAAVLVQLETWLNFYASLFLGARWGNFDLYLGSLKNLCQLTESTGKWKYREAHNAHLCTIAALPPGHLSALKALFVVSCHGINFMPDEFQEISNRRVSELVVCAL